MIVRKLEIEDIAQAAKVYIDSYSKNPWDEEYDIKKVEDHLHRFISNDINIGWVIISNMEVVGVSLGYKVACIGSDYFMIEDFCIRPDMQGMGLGQYFIKELSSNLKLEDISCIMLNTVKGFPAYTFYIKNGFTEVKSSAILSLEI